MEEKVSTVRTNNLRFYLHWLVSCLAIKKGVDSRQAITVWNEMKTPWEWQFDDLRRVQSYGLQETPPSQM